MAKWKSALSTDEPEAAGGDFEAYDGPDLPFSGVFPMKIKVIRMKQNKNEEDMIFMVLNVFAPDKDHDKHKYHGAPMFVNLNQTDQGAPYTKAFLDAVGVKWRDFLTKTILDENEPPNITRLGTLKMDGEVKVRVSTKKGRTSKQYPDAKADVGKWLPWVDPSEDPDGDYDQDDDAEDDGSAPPF